jgi:hypothetical protein
VIWTVLWLLWGAAFALIEGAALLSRQPGTTLSEHVWAWFRVKDQRPTRVTWVLRAVLYGFLGWLVIHLTLGVWPS